MSDYKLFYKQGQDKKDKSFFHTEKGLILPNRNKDTAIPDNDDGQQDHGVQTSKQTTNLQTAHHHPESHQLATHHSETPPDVVPSSPAMPGNPNPLTIFAAKLTSILGQDLDLETIKQLRLKSDGSVQRAVNFYFEDVETRAGSPATVDHQTLSDNTIQNPIKRLASATFPDSKKLKISSLPAAENNALTNHTKKASSPCPNPDQDLLIHAPSNDDFTVPPANAVSIDPEVWNERLLGSIQAEVWTTRSGSDMVRFGDLLRLERGGSKAHTDNVVRIINERNNLEFARLKESDAKFAAILIESQLCSFKGSCIFADQRLRPGDYVIVELQCFMLRSAFFHTLTEEQETQKTFFDNAKETAHEKLLRLRQEGLKQLFSKLGLGDQPSVELSQTADDLEQDGDEVTQEELSALYQRSDPPDASLKGIDPPDTFAYSLRPYQRKGLQWMLSRESPDDADPRYQDPNFKEPLNPLWQEISWPHDEGSFYVNFHNGELSLNFPSQKKKSALGGILADEMGLGKTISTLALIHSSRQSTTQSRDASFARNTTLIVAPMSLLAQWESEATKTASSSSFSIFVCYGASSQGRLREVLLNSISAPDVVLTSYGTLHADHKKLMKFRADNELDDDWAKDPRVADFGIFGVKFHRIVLDEGHNIRNRTTIAARASNDLRGEKKWILTGTPVVNKLEDLFSLIKFLGIEPWSNFALWRACVTTPFQSKSKGGRGYVNALKVVQAIMEPILLRRTKDMQSPDGTPLITLPSKTITIDRVDFTENEQALYSWIYARVKRSFQKSLDQGQAFKNYTTILAQILRLRQACCHPSLVLNIAKFRQQELEDENSGDEGGGKVDDSKLINLEDTELKDIISKFAPSQISGEFKDEETKLSDYGSATARQIMEGLKCECPICTEEISEHQAAVTSCFHVGGLDCFLEHIAYQKNKNQDAKCPICRQEIQCLYVIQRHGADMKDVRLTRYRSTGQSTKIRALMTSLRSKPIREKVVVFSQFTGFLDLVQNELSYGGFPILRFDGSLSQKERTRVLDTFATDPKPYVLLISLKAGGVGLNLVSSHQAYIMDPWWSFAIESQAIDRVHRMGQTSNVQVTRFIVGGTVEERMLKIQERKAHLAVTLGMSKEEQKERRLEDIMTLFEEE